MDIVSVKQIVPVAYLDNGDYLGLWSGNVIKLTIHNKDYELTTEEGVRGINVKVIVTMNNGSGTFKEIKNQ